MTTAAALTLKCKPRFLDELALKLIEAGSQDQTLSVFVQKVLDLFLPIA